MNILVDIVHPADVLFFLNPIRKWRRAGHAVRVVSRRKDVTGSLLDAFGVEHRIISTAGSNLVTLGLELVRRDVALLRVARQFKPDVMCGFGAVAISHVGKILGVPTVSFYDTERAPLQHRATLPFISHLHVPQSYDGPTAGNRTSRFPGTKDFSYLHPDNFTPDRNLALAAGLVEGAPNYFIRLVGWQANHDLGHAGWNADTIERFISYLSERGRVHISSERSLPEQLEDYRYRGRVEQVHHLLAYCACYIGESATMAGEAVLLGVPAVYAAADRRCYTDELAALGLLWKVPRVDFPSLCRAVGEAGALDRAVLARRLLAYMEGKINLADYVVEAVLQQVGLIG
jgi:predicted glycosyltransferase